MNRNKDMMLKELMQLDFRLYDLRLYLDTHPCDNRAIKEYNETYSKACLTRQNFENMFYNLKPNMDCDNTWKWIDSPWPWENEKTGGNC